MSALGVPPPETAVHSSLTRPGGAKMKRLAIVTTVLAALALASAALAASKVSGTYQTKLHSNALGGLLNGTWTLSFKGGKYTVADNGKAVIDGKYTIKGNKVTLRDKSGPDACPAAGVYKFKLKGKTLKFTKVSDPNPACQGRVIVLKSAFTKVS